MILICMDKEDPTLSYSYTIVVNNITLTVSIQKYWDGNHPLRTLYYKKKKKSSDRRDLNRDR